jgi:glycosyltransferase involved in cell wall biosynthesis
MQARKELMPDFHIAMARTIDFDEIERGAAEKQRPRYAYPVLARRLGAKLYQAERDAPAVTFLDRLRSRVIGSPQTWSFARDLAPRLGRRDVLYCLDVDVGVPMAAAIRRASARPKLAVYLHNLDRPRGRLAAKLFRIADTVDVFFSCCSSQLEFLRNWLKISEDRTSLLLQHVDNGFFTPGPPTPGKRRPLVVSVGLEKRDYVTLAEATKDMDIDVRVDAWSPDARRMAKSFPAQTPANMTYVTNTHTELVQLYRDADVFVLPMFPNRYSGITSLVEAYACDRPIVASRTIGLADYLTPPDGVTTVEPSDPAAMRAAILRLLEHPDEARAQARRGYESVERRYDFDRYVELVAGRLEAL